MRASLIIDRIFHTLARRWLLFLNLAVALYVGLPMLAPVLMNAGLTGPVSYTHLDVYKRQISIVAGKSVVVATEAEMEHGWRGLTRIESVPIRVIRVSFLLVTSCLLYTSRCV